MTEIKRAFLKLLFLALLGLLLLPGITLWFASHTQASLTTELREALSSSVRDDAELTAADKNDILPRIGAMTIGGLCAGDYAELAALRAELCAATAEVGQFQIAREVSIWSLLLGVLTLAVIAALSLLAYFVPRLQVQAFTSGWWSLRLIAAIEVAVQATMLVWLSYWLTAVFFEVYFVKLILIAAVLAAGAVYVAVTAIFQRVPLVNAVNGELIREDQAPQLWARIREFSQSLGTEPPKHLIGGIDTNFFVTQTPIQLQDTTVEGRSLFVSLPLLRALERDEADAVLAHEMAHFSGGDTATSAALGPKLTAYAHYMQALGQSGLTVLAFFMLNLFRATFELALSRASRAREFAADQAAARLTSAGAISRALVKIGAYASYRNTVEQELFDMNAQHQGPLQLAERVAQGLSSFTQTESFRTAMEHADIPHPFDSHPPLQQRMEHVGAVIWPNEFPAVVAMTPKQTWIDFIGDAAAIEAPLWQMYEAAFASQHEQNLAFRYEPANETERALVLRYFPDVEFVLKKSAPLRISHAGIHAPSGEIGWDDVSAIKYDDGSFGTSDSITITHPEKGKLGTSKTSKLKLALVNGERDRLKAVLGQYWQRHQIMRKIQAEMAAAA